MPSIIENLTPINHTKGRNRPIQGIVMHSMWGTHTGSIAWFKNPSAGASAHYCVSAEGQIVRCVKDEDTAWHAGIIDEVAPEWVRPNPNWMTIGIELEDKRDPNWIYPDAQRQAAAWLVAKLMKDYNISKDKIVLHKDLNPSRRSDPVGAFSFNWLLPDTAEENDDWDRAVKNLKAYRDVRLDENGNLQPEGNWEGYVNSIIGSDRDIKLLRKNYEVCKNALEECENKPPVISDPNFINPISQALYKIAVALDQMK